MNVNGVRQLAFASTICGEPLVFSTPESSRYSRPTSTAPASLQGEAMGARCGNRGSKAITAVAAARAQCGFRSERRASRSMPVGPHRGSKHYNYYDPRTINARHRARRRVSTTRSSRLISCPPVSGRVGSSSLVQSTTHLWRD